MHTDVQNGRNARAAAAVSASPALDWIVHTLWGTPGVVRVSTRHPVGVRSVERFAVLPSAADPLFLLPLGYPRATSHAVRQYRTGRRGARLSTALLTLGVRSRLAEPLLRDRVHVSLTDHVEAAALPRLLLREYVQEVFRRTDLEIAIDLGGARPQGIPTFHVVTHHGVPLGFGKIGWNRLTRPLVRNEARMLERLGQRTPRVREFAFPTLLHSGRWRDLELLIVKPAPRHQRRRVALQLPLAATDQVGTLWGTDRMRLSRSAYWSLSRDRIRLVAPLARGLDGSPLPAAAEHLEQRHGATTLDFGSGHGDWVPWSMDLVDGRLYVRDWQRSADVVPRGIDAVQFVHATEPQLRRMPRRDALQSTLDRSRRVLPRLGIASTEAELLLALHLLEMSLRFEEARAAGADAADPDYADALTELLQGPARAAA